MTTSTVGEWTGDSFGHEIFAYDSDDEVRDRCVPFVEEAVAEDQPVVVVAGAEVRELLEPQRRAAPGLFPLWESAESMWAGAAATLAAYHRAMEPLLEAGRPWRLVGQPVWLAWPGGDAWSRFEAVVNEAFAEYPYYSLCLHDTRRLDDGVVGNQRQVHPWAWDGSRPSPNPDYVPTTEYLLQAQPPWGPPPTGVRRRRITDARSALSGLEAMVDGTGTPRQREETLLAVYELVTNALKASGEAVVTHWHTDATSVWEVADDGPGLHDPAMGLAPPPSGAAEGGRGLWLARSLADDSAIRGRGPGTAVRLYFRDRV